MRAAAVTVLAAALLAGCGGGPGSYAKSDLSKLVLAGSQAPAGTRFNSTNVGVGFLEREGGNESFFVLLRPHGFVADAGSEFYGPKNRVAYAESLAFLFENGGGASKALAAMHEAFPQVGQGVRDVSDPDLGEESWGVSGVFGPKSPPGYFYMWRDRNVIRAFMLSGARSVVTESRARAEAGKLAMQSSR